MISTEILNVIVIINITTNLQKVLLPQRLILLNDELIEACVLQSVQGLTWL